MSKKTFKKVGLYASTAATVLVASGLFCFIGLYIGFYLGGAKFLIGISTLPGGAYTTMLGIIQFVVGIALGIGIAAVGVTAVDELDEKRKKISSE